MKTRIRTYLAFRYREVWNITQLRPDGSVFRSENTGKVVHVDDPNTARLSLRSYQLVYLDVPHDAQAVEVDLVPARILINTPTT